MHVGLYCSGCSAVSVSRRAYFRLSHSFVAGFHRRIFGSFWRVYAAYGGVFVVLALAWGVFVDGFRPDRYDLLGAGICVAGVLVMVVPS